MAIKVAINGFGRIGKLAFKIMHDLPEFEVVAFNGGGSIDTIAHLLKYDSAYGRYNKTVEVEGNDLIVDGRRVIGLTDRNPENLPWADLGVDVVLECTGVFRDLEGASKHIKAGAKKVIISAPGSGDMKTIVFGVNENILDGTEEVISAASCTTNCLAPVVNVLDKEFGIVKGFMTTIHAYTNDQNILDAKHKDLRRARAGAQNIIPTTTGAAKAVGLVLPQLKGKLDGNAMRVPTLTGSVVDLTLELNKNTSVEEINKIMKNNASDVLGYTEDPIVSSDVIGDEHGTIFDALSTRVMEVEGKQLVKVVTWYDNEASYTHQLVRTARYLMNK